MALIMLVNPEDNLVKGTKKGVNIAEDAITYIKKSQDDVGIVLKKLNRNKSSIVFGYKPSQHFLDNLLKIDRQFSVDEIGKAIKN